MFDRKRNNWNLLEQLDRYPVEETEESREITRRINLLYMQLLLVTIAIVVLSTLLGILPRDLFLNGLAGALGIATGIRFFLMFYHGTVFTVQGWSADDKNLARKKDRSFFLCILCEALLFQIAALNILGSETLELLGWIIGWYVIYSVAFYFYATTHPYVEEDPYANPYAEESEANRARRCSGNPEDAESASAPAEEKEDLPVSEQPAEDPAAPETAAEAVSASFADRKDEQENDSGDSSSAE